MKLNRITWTTFFFLSLISLAIWLRFSYPQLAIIDFSIDRSKAVNIAREYVRQTGESNLEQFQTASVFRMDGATNRYLQKTIGFRGLKAFLEKHDYDMFFWIVRFFAEGEKEGYVVTVHSSTGEVTAFTHTIDDNAYRKPVEKDVAREKAKEFLKNRFDFDPQLHTLRSDMETVRDHRSDFSFSWQHNDVNIPWSTNDVDGSGKLIISAKTSGDEILSFSKNMFLIPDRFNRTLDQKKDLGRDIMTLIKIIVLVLFTSSIFLIITRQNHLAMHTTKRLYITIVLISFVLSLFAFFNQYENILFAYKTTFAFHSYLWRNIIDTVMSALFVTIAVLIPGLAGELLHYEKSAHRREGALLHNLRSTFLSRNVAEQISIGYFVCILLLGLQSLLTHIGQTYFSVWVEHGWINMSSTAYLPFLAAFTFAYKASISEEILYRLYAINLGKKIFGKIFPKRKIINMLITALLSAVIWGFAHSNYPVFPVWFRGIEVSLLGIVLAFVYLKFGFIPVLVAHYLFDVFWNCSGYIFGTSTPFYFYSALFILFLPLMIAVLFFFINKNQKFTIIYMVSITKPVFFQAKIS